ncbi:MAG: bifunctional aldolase/short-chain dehydrogenase [Rhodospirillaceae bacterium]|nr:bifunctional aldolase/short-chain dehydrogenase [Rhodospirillaceae bacterium]|tara:strand:+ start:10791 stop:12827 length:2037 start_codon:yes stop_codon:yes gene_type:complete
MKNFWSDSEAQKFVKKFAGNSNNADIALRVYTSRLLGREPKLVLHGGGNTSVKTTMPDILGKETEVLCVKGSGWDLADIEPQGLPAVRLSKIKKLASLNALSDTDMVNIQRLSLLDASAPNPSVETLLHAFLPHKFVDHTHSNAILALTDQTNGDKVCQEVFGNRMGYVPYIMPGFALAKKAKEVFEANTKVDGLILFKHGIFTFADTAKDSYDLMIEMATMAEVAISKRKRLSFPTTTVAEPLADVSKIAPILRGMCSSVDNSPMLLNFRTSAKILEYVNGDELVRYSQKGTVTPDHVIHTKSKPLIVPMPLKNDLIAFIKNSEIALTKYQKEYETYVEHNNERVGYTKEKLDSIPRVILVPGLGLFGLGCSKEAASIAADLAETNIDVILDAERMGTYETIQETDIFDVEYWELEQAKLSNFVEKPLARKIVAITGGGSGIGAATAKLFASNDATVAVIDISQTLANKIARSIGGIGIGCDVTNAQALDLAFDEIAEKLGGLDILISNAGAAWHGRIGDVDQHILRKSFELNFFAHQTAAQAAIRIFQAQKIGGCLLFNASKQAVNPGRNFGPYGLPKAATVLLMKQYAIDYGEENIRSCAVNADRVRSGLLTKKMITKRAKSRGLSETEYMSGNLLRNEVTTNDVAHAFYHLAISKMTTAAILTVDGGNIEASLR